MSRQELAALGEECSNFDQHVGITGMLLHYRGSFLQVLEGRASVVRDMWVRIVVDPRHKDPHVISDHFVAEREFDSHLGFEDLDTLLADTPFLDTFDYETFAADPERAHLALLFFFHLRQRPNNDDDSAAAA
jgi:hypothetical protein